VSAVFVVTGEAQPRPRAGQVYSDTATDTAIRLSHWTSTWSDHSPSLDRKLRQIRCHRSWFVCGLPVAAGNAVIRRLSAGRRVSIAAGQPSRRRRAAVSPPPAAAASRRHHTRLPARLSLNPPMNWRWLSVGMRKVPS